jgi:hypothetical protein
MTPPSITLPAASTDELLHAVSVTTIIQQGQITALLGMVAQLYASHNGMPLEAGQHLLQQLLAANTEAANQAFTATLQERRSGLQDRLFQ